MDDQNSVSVEASIRPEQLMQELGVGKDTYYGDLKFLGIRAEKDGTGKAFLTAEQVTLVRSLRQHVEKTGKRDGFEGRSLAKIPDRNSALDVSVSEPEVGNVDQLIEVAAELKAQELVMPQLVTLELARQMTETDMPEHIQQKVQAVREAADPKAHPAKIAANILAEYRNRRGGQTESMA